MDYIALNHQAPNPYGVHYNSPKPIGGIRYYKPKRKKITVKEKGDGVKVIVEIDPLEKAPPKIEEITTTETKKIKYQEQEMPEIKMVSFNDIKEELKKEEKTYGPPHNTGEPDLSEYQAIKDHIDQDYVIELQG